MEGLLICFPLLGSSWPCPPHLPSPAKHLLATASGLPGLAPENPHNLTRLISPVLILHLCVYHRFSVFLFISFGTNPCLRPCCLLLRLLPESWNSWCQLVCSQSPRYFPVVRGTPGKHQAYHAGCPWRLPASTCLLCLVPASLNPLLTLIFKTNPGCWYSIIITYMGGKRV